MNRSVCICAVLALASCDSPTQPTPQPLVGAAPLQVDIIGPPRLHFATDPFRGLLAVVSVTAPDSTLHVSWRPTTVHVDVIGKGDFAVDLDPFACIEPNELPLPFPLSFDWIECNLAAATTSIVLTSAQLREIEMMLGGAETTFAQPLTQSSGAAYLFRVPTGREAVDEAVRRLVAHRYVVDAGPAGGEPICVLSDVVPPPPCPPWTAARAFAPTNFGGVALADGDSLVLSYVLPRGDTVAASLEVAISTPHQSEDE